MEGVVLRERFISQRVKTIIRLVLGILTLINVAARIIFTWSTEIPAIFYFTVQSNILCGLYWVFSSAGCIRGKKLIPLAVTLYMQVTGIVFSLLLDEYFTSTLYSLLIAGKISPLIHFYSLHISGIAHYTIPLLILIDYLALHDMRDIPFRRALAVLAYPLLYFVFHLGHSLLTGTYIYGFLHPDVMGSWLMVAAASVLILAAMAGILRLLLLLNKLAQDRTEQYYQGLLS